MPRLRVLLGVGAGVGAAIFARTGTDPFTAAGRWAGFLPQHTGGGAMAEGGAAGVLPKKRRDMFAATGHVAAATGGGSTATVPEGSYFVARDDGTIDRLAKWDKGWKAGRK